MQIIFIYEAEYILQLKLKYILSIKYLGMKRKYFYCRYIKILKSNNNPWNVLIIIKAIRNEGKQNK